MTRALFDAAPYDAKPGDSKQEYLKHCWIPNALCRAWFERKRLSPPKWLEGSWRAAEEWRATPAPYDNIAAPEILRPAPASELIAALREVYSARKADPPNIKAVIPLVKALLHGKGLSASGAQIMKDADAPEFKEQRRRPGHRRN